MKKIKAQHLLNLIKKIFVINLLFFGVCACNSDEKNIKEEKSMTASQILGNPKYLAMSYGGYRTSSRDVQPTIGQLKEDLKILSAMGVGIIRTYNVHLAQASNILKAIKELKSQDSSFEMYVMLGVWIDCKNSWTGITPIHNEESERNPKEIKTAVALANEYPEIIKVMAVGNEAMVRWAESYYVTPDIILKWVNHLQDLKKESKLPKELWITSSDDFSSWGGGDPSYRTKELEDIIKAVDYVSMHTYPYHNSHYNPAFWETPEDEKSLSEVEQVKKAMVRAIQFSQSQFDSVSNYVKSIDPNKTIHIGETGWASVSNGHYGVNGSRASDEYKQGLFYEKMRAWTNSKGISCFYFEAFNEPWKDAGNKEGSENHFGLITEHGAVKFALWDLLDKGTFEGLTRDGQSLTKTYDGDKKAVLESCLLPNVDYAH